MKPVFTAYRRNNAELRLLSLRYNVPFIRDGRLKHIDITRRDLRGALEDDWLDYWMTLQVKGLPR